MPVACCDLVHRGVNYAEGKILFATLDGQVIALDANTGKEVWKIKNADPAKGETMTMAGLVVKDKYIVGVSGGEFGVRGWIAAYGIADGKLAWKAFSMGPDEDLKLAADFNSANPHYGQKGMGTSTWPGDQWKIGGGTTWGWYSYDPSLNLLYYSTGNPGTWNPTPRKGDNKWSMTIFARNPDTGEAKWGYQMTPWDAWDYDGINEHILADINVGGQMKKVLVHFDRNGFAYTIDRTNGTLLVAEPFVFVNWATGIDKKTGPSDRGRGEAHQGRRRHQGHLPVRHGRQGPAAGRVLAPDQPGLRRHQQHVHELRGRRGEVHGRRALRGSQRADVPGPRRPPGRVHGLGSGHRQEGLGDQGTAAGVERRARHRRRRRLLRHAWTGGSRRSTPRPASSSGSTSCPRVPSATR